MNELEHNASEKTKMTPRQWLENYWYHYKWATLLAVFFAAVILISMVQCMTKSRPDVYFMYAGPRSLSLTQTTELENSLRENIIKEDYNADGVKRAEYLENIVAFDGDYTVKTETGEEQVVISQSEEISGYVTQVIAGDAQIYLLSPDVYSELKNESVLVPLATVFGQTPQNAYDGSSFVLGRLGIYQLPGFCDLPEDTRVCLRSVKTIGVRDAEQAQLEHVWAEDVFKSLVQYEPEK